MKKKRWILLCLMACMLLALPVSAQAASQKKKALKAYKSFLTKEKIGFLDVGGESLNVSMAACKFALAYIDNNSVPELVIYSPEIEKRDKEGGLKYGGDYYGCYSIYTYKDGKVRRTAKTQLVKLDGYYAKKGVVKEKYSGDTYYLLQNGKLKERYSRSEKLKKSYAQLVGASRIYRNEKTQESISKASFEKGVRSLTGGKKLTKVKFRVNTAANRKKYLK